MTNSLLRISAPANPGRTDANPRSLTARAPQLLPLWRADCPNEKPKAAHLTHAT
jgi:hypothetical protein